MSTRTENFNIKDLWTKSQSEVDLILNLESEVAELGVFPGVHELENNVFSVEVDEKNTDFTRDTVEAVFKKHGLELF
jgi:hypothetical protein